jgi:hypothetical protein
MSIDRRATVMTVALCALLVGAHPAVAGKGGSRSQTLRYSRPDGFRTYHWDQPYDYFMEPAQVSFDPPAGARYVHLDVVDDSGEDVMVRVTQLRDDGTVGTDLYYCLKLWTGKLVSAEPVEVRVYSGACTDHTIAVVTQGTVTATFPSTANISEMPAHHHHSRGRS